MKMGVDESMPRHGGITRRTGGLGTRYRTLTDNQQPTLPWQAYLSLVVDMGQAIAGESGDEILEPGQVVITPVVFYLRAKLLKADRFASGEGA